ncbi:hypothetical protein Misp02_18140 [Microtetraspora sp. NBRC 16547]|nr:hypothetical protein Misp02_18140 [Microtetraspora sp. NBRC 16547]
MEVPLAECDPDPMERLVDGVRLVAHETDRQLERGQVGRLHLSAGGEDERRHIRREHGQRAAMALRDHHRDPHDGDRGEDENDQHIRIVPQRGSIEE